MSDHLIAEANRHAKALTDERNNLVVELNLLREWQREVIQNARAHHAELKDAIARAERAEASLHALRLVCGTTDADKFTSWVDRANDRAERAEAEIKDRAAMMRDVMRERDAAEAELAEWHMLRLWGTTPEIVHAFIKCQQARIHAAQDIEAELAAERARLDDLVADLNDACITLASAKDDCDDYALLNTGFKLEAVRDVLLQYIPNAAMKEGK
jgi:DNA repair exonuclease SbcCD ATPase subunit